MTPIGPQTREEEKVEESEIFHRCFSSFKNIRLLKPNRNALGGGGYYVEKKTTRERARTSSYQRYFRSFRARYVTYIHRYVCIWGEVKLIGRKKKLGKKNNGPEDFHPTDIYCWPPRSTYSKKDRREFSNRLKRWWNVATPLSAHKRASTEFGVKEFWAQVTTTPSPRSTHSAGRVLTIAAKTTIMSTNHYRGSERTTTRTNGKRTRASPNLTAATTRFSLLKWPAARKTISIVNVKLKTVPFFSVVVCGFLNFFRSTTHPSCY